MFVVRVKGDFIQGNRTFHQYLDSQGALTTDKGKAKSFESEGELDRFLNDHTKDGHKLDVIKEPA